MNRSYVKVYDKNGTCVNPIIRSMIPKYPNRRRRRAYLHGEKKSRAGYVGQLIPIPFSHELTPKTGKLKKAGMALPIWKNRRRIKTYV
jgi:hypothetical protein